MSTKFSQNDIEVNRFKAGLGYFIFFIPLLLCRDSKLGRHCANQGLLLWIVSLIVSALLGIFTSVPLIGWIFVIVSQLFRFVLFLLALLCFVQLTTKDHAPELPFIGGIRILR